mmetsp:Transcript_40441/g.35895  ORF Transcript_40441/g.35895 Transcript_40441/m.35895 type:complete len:102 (-) Transcript_40441:41-346(-)
MNPYIGSKSESRSETNNPFSQGYHRHEQGNNNTPQDTFNIDHMQDTITNNFIFSVLLNSVSQNDQGGAGGSGSLDGLNFNPGSMDNEGPASGNNNNSGNNN